MTQRAGSSHYLAASSIPSGVMKKTWWSWSPLSTSPLQPRYSAIKDAYSLHGQVSPHVVRTHRPTLATTEEADPSWARLLLSRLFRAVL